MSDREPEDSLPLLPARFRLTPEFRLLLASGWIAPEGPPHQRVGRDIPNPPSKLDRECGALGITRPTPYAKTQAETVRDARPTPYAQTQAERVREARPTPYAQTQAERVGAACHDGIDWDVFLSLVDRHRVLVPHDTLRRALGDRLPCPVYEQLKSRNAEACRQTLRQAAELVRLNMEFSAHGFEMIPLKGVMLSVQLFHDPAMRSTRDLDLLVRPERLDEADQILRRDGYRLVSPDCELTPRRKKWLLRASHHFGYTHDQRHQLVELHWRLHQWKPEHVAELWDNCQTKTWMEAGFLTLKDDALLLFLCDHGSKHQWRRIKWLADVAALLAQERNLSWDNVLALADRFDLSRPLAESGLLVHWLYGIRLPEPLVDLIARQESASDMASQSVEAMLLSEKAQFTLSVRLKSAMSLGRSRERLPLGMSFRSCLLSTDEFKEFPLPDRLFWLYFPLRPLLWFYHHYIKRKALWRDGGAKEVAGID